MIGDLHIEKNFDTRKIAVKKEIVCLRSALVSINGLPAVECKDVRILEPFCCGSWDMSEAEYAEGEKHDP